MSRRRIVYVLVVLGVAALATAFILLNGPGHVTLTGSTTDPSDPDAPAETTTVKVECASPATGAELNDDGYKTNAGDLDKADGTAEDDGFSLGQQGVDPADVVGACGRLRTARLTHAGELGVLGLLLAGAAALLLSRGRRADDESDPLRSARPPRPADGAAV